MFIYTIGDIVTGVVLLIVVVLCVYQAISEHIKQSTCDHPTYRETQACDAICTKCGKNLGFIQPIREDKTKREIW